MIRWHGHSCFEISSDEGPTIVTDPHDGKSLGIKPPSVNADIVLVSHSHFDHSSTKTVMTKGSKKVDRSGKFNLMGVKIKGIESFHDPEDGRMRGENIIFKFVLDDMSLCHLGDLGHIIPEKMASKLKPIDILFIPVGGVFTLEPNQCWKVIEDINPRVVVPMHYKTGGLSISIHPLTHFLNSNPELPRIKVGNEIDFDHNDIPTRATIWEFSR